MLNLISDIRSQPSLPTQLGSYAVEASWMTGRWDKLAEYLHTLAEALPRTEETFNIGIATALQALMKDDAPAFDLVVENLFLESARPLTMTSTATLQGCHTSILQFHVLFELEMISGRYKTPHNKSDLVTILDNRLQMLGTFPSDQKYILGIRRAAMELVR
jgi:serine/threonine-protein kinase ATR